MSGQRIQAKRRKAFPPWASLEHVDAVVFRADRQPSAVLLPWSRFLELLNYLLIAAITLAYGIFAVWRVRDVVAEEEIKLPTLILMLVLSAVLWPLNPAV